MKAKQLLKKITPFVLLMALMVIVAISCKKKDDETPAPVTPKQPKQFPTKISCRPPKLMTNLEIAQNKHLPSYILSRAGKGLGEGEEGFDFGKIGDVLWEIHDYTHTEMRFNKIDDQLTDIQGQLGEISSELDSIATDLQLGVTDIENWISKQGVFQYMTNIYTLYGDTTSQYALMYFPAMAARIQRGDPTAVSLATLQQYEEAYYNANNNANVSNYINQLSTQMLQENALLAYTKTIILNNGTATSANEATNLVNAYKLLEGYFVQIINYQLQGMTIVANIDNRNDTTGNTWNTKLPGFRSMFQTEIAQFLSTVDYLVVNLYDYRNITQYQNDIAYYMMGLAPDDNFFDVNARAQFVSNVILDGFNLPYNNVGGTVVVPKQYGFTGSAPSNVTTFNIVYGGLPVQTVTANTVASQYPNTYMPAQNSCSADNQWSVFRFGQSGKVSQGVSTFQIQTADVTGNSPWAHFSAIQGTFVISYYNPQNGTSSTVQDSTYSMPFGYFSTAWWWGPLYLNYGDQTHCTNYYVCTTTDKYHITQTTTCPGLGTTDKNNAYYFHDSYNGNFFYTDENHMGYNGPMCGTSYDCIIMDERFTNLSVGPNSSGANFYVYYETDPPDFSSGSGDFYSIWAGTSFSKTLNADGYTLSSSNMLNYTDDYGIVRSGVVTASLTPGTSHMVNFGYCFQDENASGSSSHEFSLYTYPQVVFAGKLALP